MSEQPLVVAEELEREYRMGPEPVRVLRGVSLTVNAGESIAIIGASGVGKSTLLHLLGTLDRPTGGRVIFDGEDVSTRTDAALARLRRTEVGFIFQFYNLLPTLTAEENVGLPLLIDGQSLDKHRARLAGLLDLVGLADRKHHKPDQLSGGQQQRVAIARAFANDPEIVLADEPTGNLDSKSGAAILALLRRTCDELSATIVMVTHDPRAASYADRVVFLKDGVIVRELPCGAPGKNSQAIMDVMAEIGD